MDCQHLHTHTETTDHSVCQYVPRGWDDRNDDDPYETVTYRDIHIFCDDCGEYVECISGD